MMPRWSKLTRVVRDARDDVTLRTRSDIERYAIAMHGQQRERSTQWQAVARLLLEGADAAAVTRAIELALLFDGRLDVKLANKQAA